MYDPADLEGGFRPNRDSESREAVESSDAKAIQFSETTFLEKRGYRSLSHSDEQGQDERKERRHGREGCWESAQVRPKTAMGYSQKETSKSEMYNEDVLVRPCTATGGAETLRPRRQRWNFDSVRSSDVDPEWLEELRRPKGEKNVPKEYSADVSKKNYKPELEVKDKGFGVRGTQSRRRPLVRSHTVCLPNRMESEERLEKTQRREKRVYEERPTEILNEKNDELEENYREKDFTPRQSEKGSNGSEERLTPETPNKRETHEKRIGDLENTLMKVPEQQERDRKKDEQEPTNKEANQRLVDLPSEPNAVKEQSELQTLDECDWIISFDEICISKKSLGRGGWGEVLEGDFRGCKVAVKKIHDRILTPYYVQLFIREMKMASRCRHPCLLQFIGATYDDKSPLIITELMESSLRQLLERQSLTNIEISVVSLDVVRALNYLHKQNPPILHRDISSANVLLWRQGFQWRAKVSDYGTANFLKSIETPAPGNPVYSAPEAVKQKTYTTKIDVYSFGVLLLEMCVGKLPDAKNRQKYISQLKNPIFEDLVKECVQSKPEERPEVQRIITQLENFHGKQTKECRIDFSQGSADWNIPCDQIQLRKDKILGRGDYGIIYEWKYCGGAIAVKKIHDHIVSSHNRNLFEETINIASRCRHPCLVQFIGAVNIGDVRPLLVTELMESSLRTLLDEQSLTVTEISRISQDVTGAISYLHQKKPSPIIHRNITSDNVLLWGQENKWRAKLTISIATSFHQKTMTTAPGDMRYSAPEMRSNAQTVKVDIYSFGVLLCEMYTRERPDPERREKQFAKVTRRNIHDMIQKCTQKDPEKRPGIDEIAEDLG